MGYAGWVSDTIWLTVGEQNNESGYEKEKTGLGTFNHCKQGRGQPGQIKCSGGEGGE